ncbi:Cys/Met metabolism PLP-dependent enzyme [Musa troglodytarum]|uniref:cysteine-S-conjugate beta-lyase n=1 Tax=Musa troglodytarum TaxID=320322 RepID=A0A9E7GRB7_9LILI|nr:Cys/Met metabolism PLP-dependent enzyme [Musa troglodytarum]URE20203.1 Cys/Met metabolism PLP-dependent enzyme [Musa troglodytarum]
MATTSAYAASSSVVRILCSNPARDPPSGFKGCWGFSASLRFSTERSTAPLAMLSRRSDMSLGGGDREKDTSTSAVPEGFADRLDDLSSESELEEREPSVATILVSFGNSFDPYEAMSTPLYQTSTFKQPSATTYGPYDYTRSGNPTRDVLQSLMAKLEKADQAFCFTSGMAALATVTHLVEAGQEIVAGDDIYGGSDRLLSRVVPKSGVIVKRVNTSDINEVASAIGPSTKLVWLESPTNPRQQITDIHKISEIAHSFGALVMVDNSILSPVLSQPLQLGADIVMHSATKFISGHSDLMAGILAVKGDRLMHRSLLNSYHPTQSELCRTSWPSWALVALFSGKAKGAGSVLSFLTGSLALSEHIVQSTTYFSVTVSFGSVKSLISLPCFMSHASIPASVREARGLTDDLVRISVGIEDIEDLIADLDYAIRSGPA